MELITTGIVFMEGRAFVSSGLAVEEEDTRI